MKPMTLSDFADALVVHFLAVQAAGQLRPEYRATLAAGLEKMLRAQFEESREADPGACAVCELPLSDPALDLADGVVTCAACGQFYIEAMRSGGTVLRSRCTPIVSPAPATCGRVWQIAIAPGRSGPIVADTHTVCLECRPAQEAAMERMLAADARRRREEG